MDIICRKLANEMIYAYGVLNSIMEEAASLCRQPPDYDGGDGDE